MIFLLLACAAPPVGLVIPVGTRAMADGVVSDALCYENDGTGVRDYTACCLDGEHVGMNHLDQPLCAFEVEQATIFTTAATSPPGEPTDHNLPCKTAIGDVSSCCPEWAVLLAPTDGDGVWCGW